MLYTCDICGDTSTWEGVTDKGATLWSCEKCGKIFCDSCVQIDNENDDEILCNECRKTGEEN